MAQKDLKEIINEVEAKASKKEQEAPEEFIQLVTFSLDDEEYAVPITDLREIIKTTEITPIPNSPDFIRGILNLRGQIVVVIDLETRFGLVRDDKDSAKEGPEHIIITEIGESVFGVSVDHVSEVIRISASSVQKTPALVSTKIQADYLGGVVVLDQDEKKEGGQDRLLVILNLPKLLQEKTLLEIGSKIVQETGGVKNKENK